VAGAGSVTASASATATFSGAMDPSTLTSSSFTLTSPAGQVPASVSYDAASNIATLTPAAPLAPSTTYTAQLTTDVRAADGTPLGATDFVWKYTTSTCPCSLFPALLVPATQNIPTRDGRAGTGPWTYEMGVKFKVDEAMRLRGIRFYKSKSETGTHVTN